MAVAKGTANSDGSEKSVKEKDVLKGKSYSSFDGTHGPPRQSQSMPRSERHAVIQVTLRDVTAVTGLFR